MCTEQNEVFYAHDAVMSAPGHALELIVNGLGIYARDGLHQRGVPWIVPCRERGCGSDNNSSSRHSIPQLFWTRFFLELNTVLHFPIYPVSVDELGTIDENAAPLHPKVFGLATLPPLLRFSRMYLAPYFFMGSNQLCFKTTLMSHLWPHVVQNHQGAASSPPSVPPSIAAAKSRPYRIALMKSPSTNDWRAFASSPIFENLMEQNHITPISSYVPLLERMWHVNRAELLVTTWGSTMTTATSLMLPRQWVKDSQGVDRDHGTGPSMTSRHGNITNAMEGNATQHNHQQHRLLVLIHPGYCKEVSTLFRTNVQTICHFTVKHPRRSRTFYKTMSIHDGMLTDFDGGEGFCVKFLLTTSLDNVQGRDFTFQCGQFDGDEGAIRKKQKKRH